MTPTTLTNLALSRIGHTLVKALGDTTSKDARLASLHYEPCLREALRAHFWSFALKTEDLEEVSRAATYATAQYRITALEDGVEGNGISIAVESGHTAHSLELDGTSLTLRMGTHKRLTITGTTDPVTAGVLLLSPGSADIYGNPFPGSPCWNSKGTATAPVTGVFVELAQYHLRNESAATVEELVPMANYTATANRLTATNFIVYVPGVGYTIYWLYNDGVLPPRWVKTGDGTYATRNLEVVAAGVFVTIERSPGLGFVGNGILRQLQDSPGAVWNYYLYHFTDAVITHTFSGVGTSPETAVWTPFSGSPMATGTPIIKASGRPATLTEMATLMEDGGEIEELVSFEVLGKANDFVINLTPRFLAGGVAVAEVAGWTYAFALPADFIKAKTLFNAEGRKIDRFTIRRVGGKTCILCNCEVVSLEYVHYIDDPTAFDPLFVKAFTTLLAAKLGRAISGSDDIEARFLEIFEKVDLPAARTASGQETDSDENHPLRQLLDGNLTKGRGDFFGRFPRM